jgi:phosphatidylglycerol:prolipoprotein diacylglycerol transferase
MRPTLFSIRFGGSDMGLHTYGVLVAVGFAAGILLFWREGKRQGLDGGRLLDLAFWCIVAGLVGSRLAYIGLNAHDFADACFGSGISSKAHLSGCTAVLRFWEGGLVFYGGAIGAGLVILMFCRSEGWSFWRLGDLAAPTLALGHALGRVGCFFAGCCFGKVCHVPWAASFPPGSVAYQDLQAIGVIGTGAARTPPLHPTQIYEAVGELGIFIVLLLVRRRGQVGEADAAHGARRPGGLILLYAASYAALRFVVEIFRGDVFRRYLFELSLPRVATALGLPPDEPLLLSVSQFASVVILAAVVGVMAWRRTQRQPTRAATTA